MVIRTFFIYLTLFPCASMLGTQATIALRDAVKKGDLAQIHLCIGQGADVNDREGCDWPHAGRTMLTDAIDSKSTQALELLLKAGASVEEFSDVPFEYNRLKPATRNVPQLSYAIMVNAPIKIIELLIQYSKNINAPDIYIGWTPYSIAQYYKHAKAMDLLLHAGAQK